MLQSIINQVVPVLVTAIVGVLVVSIKAVGDSIVDFITKKKEAVAVNIGIDKYNSELQIAKNVWNIVDEYFRITPTVNKTIGEAQKKFEEELLKRIPSLTADDIEHLRQAVAGEVNKGKEAIELPVAIPETVPAISVSKAD